MTQQIYIVPHNKIVRAKVSPFEFGKNGEVLSWKVLPVSENGNTPSKTARRNFRRNFGQTVFKTESEANFAISKIGEK